LFIQFGLNWLASQGDSNSPIHYQRVFIEMQRVKKISFNKLYKSKPNFYHFPTFFPWSRVFFFLMANVCSFFLKLIFFTRPFRFEPMNSNSFSLSSKRLSYPNPAFPCVAKVTKKFSFKCYPKISPQFLSFIPLDHSMIFTFKMFFLKMFSTPKHKIY